MLAPSLSRGYWALLNSWSYVCLVLGHSVDGILNSREKVLANFFCKGSDKIHFNLGTASVGDLWEISN